MVTSKSYLHSRLMTVFQDPLSCLHAYLFALIQQDYDFVLLRQSIPRINQLTSSKPVSCRYSPLNDCLLVRQEGNSLKSYQLGNFDQIQWGHIESNIKIKFICIALKNDRNPIILYGPTEIMELWYDGLQLSLNRHNQEIPCIQGVITNSSIDKLDIFTKALSYANTNRNTIDIQPPPPNFQFNSNFR
ncbi:hypothetical protein M9Y10_044126 [Tritrichomonas musculus]|uniref:PH domain-containing protein n=1 Tax=Tritrichomonas musculus TaxID=1915356 RepID=A0ABR2K277_9EUKA